MYVQGNLKTYNYRNQSGRLNLQGSGNTMNLINCMAQVSIMGNENNLKLKNFYGKVQIIGHGSKILLIGCPQISIGVRGNKNNFKIQDIEGETLTKLRVHQNLGQGNSFPMTKELDFRNPFYRRSETNKKDNEGRQLIQIRNNFSYGYPTYFPYNFHMGPPLRHNIQMRQNQNRQISSYYFSNSDRQIIRPVRQMMPVRFEARQAMRPVRQAMRPVRQACLGLTQDQLKLLPISKFEGRQDQKCIICIEKINQGQQIVFLPCFHCFHSQCIYDWLIKSATCPLCLVKIKEILKYD